MMKRMLFIAVLASFFFACSKESQQKVVPVFDTTESVQSDTTFTQVFTASDRDAAYQFGLLNSTLANYCFDIKVTEVGSTKRVWSQGGCYTGNRFFTVYLTPGVQYAATLTLTPWNPGQTGTIHWQLRNYAGYVMCNQGDMGIPSSQSLLWNACQ